MKIFMWLHEIWSRYSSQRNVVLRQVEEALSRLQRNHAMTPQRRLDFKTNCDRVIAFLDRPLALNTNKETLLDQYDFIIKRYNRYHFKDLTINLYQDVQKKEAQYKKEILDLKREMRAEALARKPTPPEMRFP
ncbi:hypothetical protein LRP49_07790 [Enterovibrio sp. ZSDZ35]|uniref:Uncharacterized protein n=1 Tax=Enterovibrio qingdaonensis TaxID=2899818 RepID=A0ABT5QJE3_9GAMM|nr:hypothetical protein [Enterovibrio sp. ZSDZ35]MDD1781104.1 hypothetical protein [Enterovibrio sp. ZSDZ35]